MLVLAASIGAAAIADAPPGISAESCIMIEAGSGTLIYQKNAQRRMSMASTTKIMTGLLLAEHGELDTTIEVTDEMVRVEGSAMGLRPGDMVDYRSLLNGLMLVSGNDAANTIALSLAGSIEKFASMMNARAAELGMTGTHFVTPSGLDHDDHYTTAYDMALLGRAALQNTELAQIVRSTAGVCNFGNPPKQYTFSNHNRLLRNYKGAIGIKTGFTKKSGRCLVSAAEKDGKTVVIVTLNASDDWNDHKKLFDFGFSMLEVVQPDNSLPLSRLPVAGSDDTIEICAGIIDLCVLKGTSSRITRRVILPDFLLAPVELHQTIGYIEYFLNEKPIGRAEILAGNAADYTPAPQKPQSPVWQNFIYILGIK